MENITTNSVGWVEMTETTTGRKYWAAKTIVYGTNWKCVYFIDEVQTNGVEDLSSSDFSFEFTDEQTTDITEMESMYSVSIPANLI